MLLQSYLFLFVNTIACYIFTLFTHLFTCHYSFSDFSYMDWNFIYFIFMLTLYHSLVNKFYYYYIYDMSKVLLRVE